MLMKLLGLTLIVFSSGLCGINYVSARKERLAELGSFISMLELIMAELVTNQSPLPEILHKISDNICGKASDFAKLMLLNLSVLGEKGFDTIWSESLRACEISFSIDEYQSFMKLGAILGKYEIEFQIRAIEDSLWLLKKREESYSAAYPQTKRLSLGLSVSAGLMLAIILV